eukprot:9374609-Pyramimonas_sp.AAC.1
MAPPLLWSGSAPAPSPAGSASPTTELSSTWLSSGWVNGSRSGSSRPRVRASRAAAEVGSSDCCSLAAGEEPFVENGIIMAAGRHRYTVAYKTMRLELGRLLELF